MLWRSRQRYNASALHPISPPPHPLTPHPPSSRHRRPGGPSGGGEGGLRAGRRARPPASAPRCGCRGGWSGGGVTHSPSTARGRRMQLDTGRSCVRGSTTDHNFSHRTERTKRGKTKFSPRFQNGVKSQYVFVRKFTIFIPFSGAPEPPPPTPSAPYTPPPLSWPMCFLIFLIIVSVFWWRTIFYIVTLNLLPISMPMGGHKNHQFWLWIEWQKCNICGMYYAPDLEEYTHNI